MAARFRGRVGGSRGGGRRGRYFSTDRSEGSSDSSSRGSQRGGPQGIRGKDIGLYYRDIARRKREERQLEETAEIRRKLDCALSSRMQDQLIGVIERLGKSQYRQTASNVKFQGRYQKNIEVFHIWEEVRFAIRKDANSFGCVCSQMTGQIKLQSSDGVIFNVDIKVAQCSVVIKQMLENLGVEENEEDVVPLFNVDAETLERVLAWATHHQDDHVPTNNNDNVDKSDDVISRWEAEVLRKHVPNPGWDEDFMKVHNSILIELIMAANYLDIPGLLELSCKTVANRLKNKSAEEIRKEFNITNDFTPAEEEQIRKENEWICWL